MKIFMLSTLVGLFCTGNLYAQSMPLLQSGPNCHIVNVAKSTDDGASYRQIAKNVLKAASVPDAVSFEGKSLIYYVNGGGGFEKHSIYVSELTGNGTSSKVIGPIKIDGEIVKDAVDPDLIVMPNGKLRLFYYVGYFTVPVKEPKPNKIYSAISSDGINFKSEGAVVSLKNPSDPTVAMLKDGSFLLAVPQGERMQITLYTSKTGYNFKKLKTISGGIPELSIRSDGAVNLTYQEKDMVLKTSVDGGKTWVTSSRNLVKGAPTGSSSPSIMKLKGKESLMYYFWGQKNCTTSPTEFLKDKGALGGMQPINSQMGEPPLGHGVKPKGKKKKKKAN